MTSPILLRPSDSPRSASLHDRIIGALPNQKPRWLLEGSLLDHQWKVATDDPEKKRNAVQFIVHNVVVAPGGGRLSDPEREHDLITSKVLAYCQMEPPNLVTALTAQSRIRMFHWLIRWRDEAGFFRMADLNKDEIFRQWCERTRYGQSALLDWPARIEAFIADITNGQVDLPTRLDLNRNPVVNHEAVAHLLGVTSMKSIPDTEYRRLLEFFESHGMLQFQMVDTLHLLRTGAPTPRKSTTREGLVQHMMLWEALWDARRYAVHDPVGFHPFATKSAWVRSGEFTSDVAERTRTAPEEQVCFLVDRALRWVTDYAAPIVSAVERLEAIERTGQHPTPKQMQMVREVLQDLKDFEGPAAPRIYRGAVFHKGVTKGLTRREAGTVSLHEAAFDLLPTTCAIVIATFTARRKEEIASLQEDCIERDADGAPWMLTWIEKTIRDIDRIPVPESVVRAVDILTKLSALARHERGDRWLFKFMVPFHNSNRDYHFGPSMRHFANFIGVPPLPDGSDWAFAPHQFRRFFAIVYYHRFRYASLTALSAFLKHYDPDMTRRYISESTAGSLVKVREAANAAAARVKEMKAANAATAEIETAKKHLSEIKSAEHAIKARQRDFEDGRLEAEFSRMWAAASGEESIGGHRGETLKTELETMILAARRQVELAPAGSISEATAFNDLLRGFVTSHVFEPHPQGHSYCGCSRSADDLAAASCLQQKALIRGEETAALALGPDYAFADARTCSGCPHNIQMQENRRWWEQRLRGSLGQAQTAITEHFAHVARADAGMCDAHIRRCFDDARPMNVVLGQAGHGNG
ncbi:MAG: hypothetical protein ACM3Q1_15585 [Bacteroidales bacterium]